MNYCGHLEKPLPSNWHVPHLFILSLRYQSYIYLFFYSSHICQLSNSTQEVFSLPFPPPFPFLPSSIIVLFKLSLHLLSLFISHRKSVKTHLLKYLCNAMSLSLLLQRTRNKCFGKTFDRKSRKSCRCPDLYARINTTHHIYANEHRSGVFKKLFFNSLIDLSFTSANSQILSMLLRHLRWSAYSEKGKRTYGLQMRIKECFAYWNSPVSKTLEPCTFAFAGMGCVDSGR